MPLFIAGLLGALKAAAASLGTAATAAAPVVEGAAAATTAAPVAGAVGAQTLGGALGTGGVAPTAGVATAIPQAPQFSAGLGDVQAPALTSSDLSTQSGASLANPDNPFDFLVHQESQRGFGSDLVSQHPIGRIFQAGTEGFTAPPTVTDRLEGGFSQLAREAQLAPNRGPEPLPPPASVSGGFTDNQNRIQRLLELVGSRG